MGEGILLDDLFGKGLDFTRALHPVPGSNDAFHQVCLGGIARNGSKIFYCLTSRPWYAKSLTFMLAAAFSGYLSIALSQNSIINTYINFKLIFASGIRSPEVECIPEQPFCLPGLYAIFKLFREPVRAGCSVKTFPRQDGRSRMMTVSCTAIARETGNNYVRLKPADNPDDITEYFFFVPG